MQRFVRHVCYLEEHNVVRQSHWRNGIECEECVIVGFACKPVSCMDGLCYA